MRQQALRVVRFVSYVKSESLRILYRHRASATVSAHTEVRLAPSTFATFQSFRTTHNSTPCVDVGNATWRRLVYRTVYRVRAGLFSRVWTFVKVLISGVDRLHVRVFRCC